MLESGTRGLVGTAEMDGGLLHELGQIAPEAQHDGIGNHAWYGLRSNAVAGGTAPDRGHWRRKWQFTGSSQGIQIFQA